MKIVLSAFPGTGKSEIFKRASELGLDAGNLHYNEETQGYDLHVTNANGIPVFDSDSSKFDKAEFPGNYIKHIQTVLDKYENVVILVSSHDNVREALREAGIDYYLVYPQIELKADYLQRYTERGSPEAFVTMMDEKWVDFITSCENDPTPHKFILSEGEYLMDAFKTIRDSQSSDGVVNTTTATIVDVNTNTDTAIVAVPSPDQKDPSLLNIPENSDDPNLAVEQNEDDPTRADLIEYKLEMQNDLDVLSEVIESNSDGISVEGMEDHGELLTAAAKDIHERYGVEIEPTLAGLEGFFDSLKQTFEKLTGKLKSTPTKQDVTIIKKYLFENEKAAKVYGTKEWQESQSFINVGKVQLQVPEIFKDISKPSDVETALKLINKRASDAFEKHLKNTIARTHYGLKIFNAVKNKKESDPISLVADQLPIKPPYMEGAGKDSGLDELNVKFTSVELPVLTAEKVNDVVKVMNEITDTLVKFIRLEEQTWDLDVTDEFLNSDYLTAHETTKEVKALWDVVSFEGEEPSFNVIDKLYRDKMMNVAKFLEMWILKSVK